MPETVRTDLVFKVKDTDVEKNLVFGWASVTKNAGGDVIADTQGDIIKSSEIEKGAYLFVKNSRMAGEMHEKMGVGTLVESMVFTKEKQAALGISVQEGWWVGFEVTPEVFAKVKSGVYKDFSIGGRGKRKVIED